MPLSFKFPERPLSNKDDLMQQPGPRKDKTKKNKANKKLPSNNIAQVKTTSPPNRFINEHMIVEQFEIEETTTVESVLDRPSLSIAPGSSAVSAEKLPSIYLGHVLFNDHKLLLPLFNGSNSKSIGKSCGACRTGFEFELWPRSRFYFRSRKRPVRFADGLLYRA